MSSDTIQYGQVQIKLDERDMEQISSVRRSAARPDVRSETNDRSKLNWGDFALGAIVGIGTFLVLKALTDQSRK